MKELTELQQNLNDAYKLLSAVPVKGDAVDVMAAAREHLRKAFDLAKETEDG